MSAYMEIYVRDKKAVGPFICLEIWPRSTKVYKAFEYQVKYESYEELTSELLAATIHGLEGELQRIDERLAYHSEYYEFITTATLSDDLRMDLFHQYQETKVELEDEKEETQQAIETLQHFATMVEDSQYVEDAGIYYIAHECDPNLCAGGTDTDADTDASATTTTDVAAADSLNGFII